MHVALNERFIHAFIHSFIHSCIQAFMHSCIHAFQSVIKKWLGACLPQTKKQTCRTNANMLHETCGMFVVVPWEKHVQAIDERMDEWTNEWMHGCMDEWNFHQLRNTYLVIHLFTGYRLCRQPLQHSMIRWLDVPIPWFDVGIDFHGFPKIS